MSEVGAGIKSSARTESVKGGEDSWEWSEKERPLCGRDWETEMEAWEEPQWQYPLGLILLSLKRLRDHLGEVRAWGCWEEKEEAEEEAAEEGSEHARVGTPEIQGWERASKTEMRSRGLLVRRRERRSRQPWETPRGGMK